MTHQKVCHPVFRVMIGILLVLVLASCSGLPRSSPPHPFDVRTPVTAPLVLSAGGPAQDASPHELVQSFLLACAAGISDDFTAARSHLSAASAQKWNPSASVEIFPTDATPDIGEPADNHDMTQVAVTLKVPALASVDARGILTRASGSTLDKTFHLVREEGQWRIDAPEDGIVISHASFLASHDLVDLRFPTTSGDALVADPRWYPSRRLASHLLEGLVGGPRETLAPVVTNAMPIGAVLDTKGVEISDGLAHVTMEATVPTGREATLLQWQIAQTLQEVPTIVEVHVSVSGQLLPTQTPTGPEYALDTAATLTEKGFGYWSGSTIRDLDLRDGPASGASDVAVGPVGASPLVWREGSLLTVTTPSEQSRRVIRVREAKTRTSVDRFGWVWLSAAEAASPSRTPLPEGVEDLAALASSAPLVALDPMGRTALPTLPKDVADGLVAILVNPDGVGAVLLRRNGASLGIWRGVIERSSDGTPMAVSGISPVEDLATGVVDISWAGTSRLVALVTTQDGPRRNQDGLELRSVDVGGFIAFSSVPLGATAISAGGTTSLVVTLEDGTHQLRSGALWQPTLPTATSVRHPG